MASDPGPEDVPTAPLVGVPHTAPLARIALGKRPHLQVPTLSITSARDAMRDEEIARTRRFIEVGWGVSLMAGGTVFFVDTPKAIAVTFVLGLLIGAIVSIPFYRAFRDPNKFTERALITLALTCVINGHIAVLFYGAYSGVVLLIVVGVYFIARTELVRVARWAIWSALAAYTVLATLIASGLMPDPGVFAPDDSLGRPTLIIGTVFVLGTYVLAYYSGSASRVASLTSIEELQRATRLASQREALMEELRADLERALRVGGPGRYTDEQLGKYKLGIVLGRGAMGEVYQAIDTTTGGSAAVKLLRRELLSDPTQVARFLREVRASAAIDSPHVVRVLDASAAEAGLPYLAMERLSGTTLAELLRAEPRLSLPATLELCRQAGIGVDAAAALGIVHRDLKPQNLMHCDDSWKILDFGVASLAEDTATLTHGDIVGTPHYMAPEQARGQRVDPRADLYAIAAIAYRCMTGRHPFTATDTPSLLYAVVHRAPIRPGALADLPHDIDRWCALALAKSPDERFGSGSELADALAAAIDGQLDAKLRRRADALVRKLPWESA